jgi:transcription initiation factor TFIIB
MDLNSLFDTFDTLKPPKRKIEITDEDYCDDCKMNSVINNNGEFICNKCGEIKDLNFDYNAEWRYYGNEDTKSSDPTRCGLPTNELLPESSNGSTISFKNGETYEMRKIRNYHGWNAMPYKERSLYNVFDSIQVRAINSGITSCIIEEAKNLYKKIAESKISRGANRKGLIASCIYKACKIKNVPRSHKEIATIFDINITHMTKGCKKFDEIMNLNKNNSESADIIGSQSIDYIQRFCSKLHLSQNILEVCKYVCLKAEEYSLVSENTPPSIASGSIWLTCTLLNINNITKKDISQICKISEVTISKCFKKLLQYHKHLLPEYVLQQLYK